MRKSYSRVNTNSRLENKRASVDKQSSSTFTRMAHKTPKKSHSAAKHNQSSIFKQQPSAKYQRDPQFFGPSDRDTLTQSQNTRPQQSYSMLAKAQQRYSR